MSNARRARVLTPVARSGVAFLAVLATTLLAPARPSAQQNVHLNPVMAKLAEGKTVFGLITGDLSFTNARETARAPVDFVYADLEHNPLDFPALNMFLLGMTDNGAVLKKGNLQPNVALFARFPPEADQSQWVVKQALDIGLMGVIFNGVDSKEQALLAVRSMRYPQLKGSSTWSPPASAGTGPPARRGSGVLSAAGVRTPRRPLAAQSRRRSAGHDHDRVGGRVEAPRRDRFGSRRRGACFSALAPTCRVRSAFAQNAPEVEAGFQQVLAACKAHNVPCAITADSANDVVRRVREGLAHHPVDRAFHRGGSGGAGRSLSYVTFVLK